jgi:hypothetical protein
MTRKLLAFLLSELKTVRLICQQERCGAVTEVSIAKMRTKFTGGACPLCDAQFVPERLDGKSNALVLLAFAIQELQEQTGTIQLEFVLPDNG